MQTLENLVLYSTYIQAYYSAVTQYINCTHTVQYAQYVHNVYTYHNMADDH